MAYMDGGRVCALQASHQKVAVKVYEKYKLLDQQRRKSVRREIRHTHPRQTAPTSPHPPSVLSALPVCRLLQRLCHPSIVRMYEAIDTPKQIYIIMEYLGGGSLHAFLKTKAGRRLDETQARGIFLQVGVRALRVFARIDGWMDGSCRCAMRCVTATIAVSSTGTSKYRILPITHAHRVCTLSLPVLLVWPRVSLRTC